MIQSKQATGNKIILDLCGGTGAWSRPYLDAGYDVRIIDLEQDVRLLNIITSPVHGILAAPPCTVFASSGARWPRTEDDMREGLSVVDACLRIIYAQQPAWWAMENPVGKLVRYLGKPVMYFQPWEYGDPYTKKTCLWGRFNTPIKRPTSETLDNRIHRMPPSRDRAKLRSITPPGFAKAFFDANA